MSVIVLPAVSSNSLIYKTKTADTVGCLSKGWYNIDGATYLIKGNSNGALSADGTCGYEPYSEVFASRLGEILGFDVIHYELGNATDYPDIHVYNGVHVSICREYELGFGELKYSAYNLVKSIYGTKVKQFTFKEYLKFWQTLNIDIQSIYNMFLLDAITGNIDRHLNNFDFIIKGGSVRCAPILDFGMGCLSLRGYGRLKVWAGIGPDDCKPFARSHTEQLALFKGYKKPSSKGVYDEWERIVRSELDLLPALRRAAIKNYIKHRLEVFL